MSDKILTSQNVMCHFTSSISEHIRDFGRLRRGYLESEFLYKCMNLTCCSYVIHCAVLIDCCVLLIVLFCFEIQVWGRQLQCLLSCSKNPGLGPSTVMSSFMFQKSRSGAVKFDVKYSILCISSVSFDFGYVNGQTEYSSKFSSTMLAMDNKQEEGYIDITPNPDEDEWWRDVQTFDFGVQIEKENHVANRFAEVTDDEIRNMSKKKNATNTDEATKSGLRILIDYCSNVDVAFPTPETTAAELNALLSKFYIAARTKKGEMYRLNSLKSIRFALQRHFLEANNIDIIDHEELIEANLIFKNVLKSCKSAGKGDTNHYPERYTKTLPGI